MSDVKPEEVRALARLARLSVTDDQAEQFAGELGQILTYIEQLQSVDVEGVPEYVTARVPGSGLREDAVGEMFSTDQALAPVPEKRGRLVVVPKFKEA